LIFHRKSSQFFGELRFFNNNFFTTADKKERKTAIRIPKRAVRFIRILLKNNYLKELKTK